jgi:hypothetical protein
MVSVVKCLICNQELKYSPSDPSELIEHLNTEHQLQSKRSRKSTESLRKSKESFSSDLRNSLEKNSKSLASLIDKEIQTEVDFKLIRLMMSEGNENS